MSFHAPFCWEFHLSVRNVRFTKTYVGNLLVVTLIIGRLGVMTRFA